MPTTTDVVDDVADSLADFYPPSLRPEQGWRHLVEKSLALSGDVPEGLGRRARDDLERFAGRLSAGAKQAHCRQLGQVAQRAFRLSSLHRDCAQDPKMAERAAQYG